MKHSKKLRAFPKSASSHIRSRAQSFRLRHRSHLPKVTLCGMRRQHNTTYLRTMPQVKEISKIKNKKKSWNTFGINSAVQQGSNSVRKSINLAFLRRKKSIRFIVYEHYSLATIRQNLFLGVPAWYKYMYCC